MVVGYGYDENNLIFNLILYKFLLYLCNGYLHRKYFRF